MCVRFKDPLFNTTDPWTPANGTVTHVCRKLTQHTVVLPKAPHRPPVLRDTIQPSALSFGALLHSKGSRKKQKNVKNVALNKLWKEYLLLAGKRKQAGTVESRARRVTSFSLLRTCPQWSLWVSVLVLQINFSKWANLQIWTLWIMGTAYVSKWNMTKIHFQPGRLEKW